MISGRNSKMAVTLAQLIRSARKRSGDMTQKEVSRLIGTSIENVTSIENGRNLQPRPQVITGLSKVLDLPIEDIYAAITGTLEELPWEKPREIKLRDPELEFMFRQVDKLADETAKENVKAYIRFVLSEEKRTR